MIFFFLKVRLESFFCVILLKRHINSNSEILEKHKVFTLKAVVIDKFQRITKTTKYKYIK